VNEVNEDAVIGDERFVCPMCEDSDTQTKWCIAQLTYGVGEKAVELTVRLPIRRCDACDIEFLDHVGEELKHEAICRHRGVLSPREIKKIRQRHGVSRARFAQLTGLGEASLNRWENALNIQSPANDRYLRLLASPDVWQRLEVIARGSATDGAKEPWADRFPHLKPVAQLKRAEQEHFVLRKAA